MTGIVAFFSLSGQGIARKVGKAPRSDPGAAEKAMAGNMEGPSWNPITLRRGVLGVACIETAVIFVLLQLSSEPASPAGPIKMTPGALLALAVFFLLVLPAWLLAWFNRALLLALGLAAGAAAGCAALFLMLSM